MSSQVAVAQLGGVAAELLHWYALSRRPGGIGRFKVRTAYWVTTAGMVLLGAVMPVLYKTIRFSKVAHESFHRRR